MNYKYLFFISILLLSSFINTTILKAEDIVPTPNESGILFVKKGSTGNGSSWDEALGELSDALTGTNPEILQIWVSAGTYQPLEGQSFLMKEGVKMYGGFIGTEDELSQRDWDKNSVTLQGNGTTVVRANSLTSNSVLDGFTVTGGSGAVYGGGMYNYLSSTSISNCKFINNSAIQGGGVRGWSASPIFTNCLFSGNSADAGGAMMNDYASTPVIMNCRFENNSSSGNGGAILNAYDLNLKMINCIVTGNSAGKWGGGIHAYECSVELANCVFTNNEAINSGGEIYCDDLNLKIVNSTIYNNHGEYFPIFGRFSSPTFTNSIIWADMLFSSTPEISYCIVKDSSNTSNGNINATLYTPEQIFTNPSIGDFTLIKNSPAINSGSNEFYNVSAYGNSDVSGATRIIDATIDMGAYESIEDVLGISESITSKLRTYPNPVSEDLFYIDMESLNSDENATLFDMYGKAVKVLKAVEGINEVNVSELPKGVYLLQMSQGKATKIVIK